MAEGVYSNNDLKRKTNHLTHRLCICVCVFCGMYVIICPNIIEFILKFATQHLFEQARIFHKLNNFHWYVYSGQHLYFIQNYLYKAYCYAWSRFSWRGRSLFQLNGLELICDKHEDGYYPRSEEIRLWIKKKTSCKIWLDVDA